MIVNVADLMPASSPSWILVDLGLEALPLRPAQIHAHQHLGPVLALRAARAGMHGHDRVQRGRSRRRASSASPALPRYLPSDGDLALQLRLDRLAFARQLEVRLDVARAARQLRIVGKLLLQPLALAHQHLRLRRLPPHRRIGQLLFYCFQVRAAAVRASKILPQVAHAIAHGSVGKFQIVQHKIWA